MFRLEDEGVALLGRLGLGGAGDELETGGEIDLDGDARQVDLALVLEGVDELVGLTDEDDAGVIVQRALDVGDADDVHRALIGDGGGAGGGGRRGGGKGDHGAGDDGVGDGLGLAGARGCRGSR